MSDIGTPLAAKAELIRLDREIERIANRLENDSDLGRLSYDVGASDADYENFIGDVSAALLGLCCAYREALLARIADGERKSALPEESAQGNPGANP